MARWLIRAKPVPRADFTAQRQSDESAGRRYVPHRSAQPGLMSDQSGTRSGARQAGLNVILAWAKAAVSVGLLWLLFSAYDIGESVGRLAAIEGWALSVAAIAIPLSLFSVALRWRIILASLGERLAIRAAFALVMIGIFFNQVLPSNVGGDAVRVWRLCRRGVTLGHSLGSVMLDRVISMFALALLVLATLPLALRMIADATILAVFSAFVIAVIAGLAALLVLDRLSLLVSRYLPRRLVDALSSLARDSRTVLLDRDRAFAVLGLAILNQLLMVLLIAVLAWGLGIRAPALSFLVLVPPALLASMLPLSFAGWGVREGVMVALFGAVGVAPGEALALSVAFGLVVLAGSLPGGVIWLVTGNRADSGAGAIPPGDRLP